MVGTIVRLSHGAVVCFPDCPLCCIVLFVYKFAAKRAVCLPVSAMAAMATSFPLKGSWSLKKKLILKRKQILKMETGPLSRRWFSK